MRLPSIYGPSPSASAGPERIVRSICVFCGSNTGAREAYAEAARNVAHTIAERGFRLVYGGAAVGLMGVLADAALAAGGDVVGIIPGVLVEREIAHAGLTELHPVNSMHERKAMMADLADGFIALPGGAGTLEEFFEIWTWGQLGHHRKPVGLLNVGGFFDPLIAFLDRQEEERFMRREHRDMLIIERDPASLLDRFETYRPPVVEKWIRAGER
jgi:uncharacterized protein (TIGR00730 family)